MTTKSPSDHSHKTCSQCFCFHPHRGKYYKFTFFRFSVVPAPVTQSYAAYYFAASTKRKNLNNFLNVKSSKSLRLSATPLSKTQQQVWPVSATEESPGGWIEHNLMINPCITWSQLISTPITLLLHRSVLIIANCSMVTEPDTNQSGHIWSVACFPTKSDQSVNPITSDQHRYCDQNMRWHKA